MIRLLTIFCAFLIPVMTFAQGGPADNIAKEVLDKVRAKYDGYGGVDAIFTLELEFPGQPVEVQEGKLKRHGDRYRMDISTQTVIGDGKAIYLVLHNNKEVQINNLPDPSEGGDLLTPEGMLTFYDSGDFMYAVTDEFVKEGTTYQQIEFKPLDKYSDYAKLRMTINKKTSSIEQVKAFGKDGGRYTFKLKKLKSMTSFPDDTFIFKQKDFPGYYVEDLRD